MVSLLRQGFLRRSASYGGQDEGQVGIGRMI